LDQKKKKKKNQLESVIFFKKSIRRLVAFNYNAINFLSEFEYIKLNNVY